MKPLNENTIAGQCLKAAEALKHDGAHQILSKAVSDGDMSADHADRMLMAVRNYTATVAAAQVDLMVTLSTIEG